MSEPINVDARVDELSQPGNEAELAKVLNAEFNNETLPADSKPAEAAPAAEPKPAEPAKQPEPTPAPQPKEGEGEPSKAGEQKAGEEANKGKNRIEEILADRNEAKTAAAEAQTDVQILTKQVQDLTAIVEKLTSGKQGEGEGTPSKPGEPSADDKLPQTKEELLALIDELTNKKNEASDKAAAAEKSITDAIQALNADEYPHAEDFKTEISEVMRKFTGMKAFAAYNFLVGNGVIPTEVISSNANRTGTGNRSKSSLVKNKSAEDMTQAEREAYLFGEQKAGNLNI